MVKVAALVAIAAVAAFVTTSLLSEPQRRYLTVNPSVSQRFLSIPSEESLADLCFRLQRVQGVTGVSYRDYSARSRSAIVTVFFDPVTTSARQLRVFLLHTNLLWQQEMKA